MPWLQVTSAVEPRRFRPQGVSCWRGGRRMLLPSLSSAVPLCLAVQSKHSLAPDYSSCNCSFPVSWFTATIFPCPPHPPSFPSQGRQHQRKPPGPGKQGSPAGSPGRFPRPGGRRSSRDGRRTRSKGVVALLLPTALRQGPSPVSEGKGGTPQRAGFPLGFVFYLSSSDTLMV